MVKIEKVTEEAHHLAGQFWAGTIYRKALTILGLVTFIWILTFAWLYLLLKYSGESIWNSNAGCLLNSVQCLLPSFFIQSLLLIPSLGLIALGGYFITVFAQKKKFQQSALFTAFNIIVIGILGFTVEANIVSCLILIVLAFFICYGSYRLGLKRPVAKQIHP